jgi:hypothetical protein
MPYNSIIVTPIVEQSGFKGSEDHVFRVSLHFKLWDKTHLYGDVTYFRSKKAGEFFTYDAVIRDFVENMNNENIEEIHNVIKKEVNRDLQTTNSLVPLQQFICDRCGVITDVDDLVLEFTSKHDNTGAYNYDKVINNIRIVHCSEEIDCTFTSDEIKKIGGAMQVGIFTGERGLANLISLMEEYSNEPSLKAIMEILKRSHLPHYEEARSYSEMIEDNANSLDWDMMKYHRENLRSVILDIHHPEDRAERKRKTEEVVADLKKKGWIKEPGTDLFS